MNINGLGVTDTPTTSPANPDKLKESARQFEALLIGQMLKSVRESGGSWMGGGEDESASAAIGMAEEQLAQTLAAQGGLGLTSMVMQGLAKRCRAIESVIGVVPTFIGGRTSLADVYRRVRFGTIPVCRLRQTSGSHPGVHVFPAIQQGEHQLFHFIEWLATCSRCPCKRRDAI